MKTGAESGACIYKPGNPKDFWQPCTPSPNQERVPGWILSQSLTSQRDSLSQKERTLQADTLGSDFCPPKL